MKLIPYPAHLHGIASAEVDGASNLTELPCVLQFLSVYCCRNCKIACSLVLWFQRNNKTDLEPMLIPGKQSYPTLKYAEIAEILGQIPQKTTSIPPRIFVLRAFGDTMQATAIWCIQDTDLCSLPTHKSAFMTTRSDIQHRTKSIWIASLLCLRGVKRGSSQDKYFAGRRHTLSECAHECYQDKSGLAYHSLST